MIGALFTIIITANMDSVESSPLLEGLTGGGKESSKKDDSGDQQPGLVGLLLWGRGTKKVKKENKTKTTTEAPAE
jgi:hypothetical protein